MPKRNKTRKYKNKRNKKGKTKKSLKLNKIKGGGKEKTPSKSRFSAPRIKTDLKQTNQTYENRKLRLGMTLRAPNPQQQKVHNINNQELYALYDKIKTPYSDTNEEQRNYKKINGVAKFLDNQYIKMAGLYNYHGRFILNINIQYNSLTSYNQGFYVVSGIGSRLSKKEEVMHMFQRYIIAPYYGIVGDQFIKYSTPFFKVVGGQIYLTPRHLRFWHVYLFMNTLLRVTKQIAVQYIVELEVIYKTIKQMFNKPEELLKSIQTQIRGYRSLWKRINCPGLVDIITNIIQDILETRAVSYRYVDASEPSNTHIVTHEIEIEHSALLNRIDVLIHNILESDDYEESELEKHISDIKTNYLEISLFDEQHFVNHNKYV